MDGEVDKDILMKGVRDLGPGRGVLYDNAIFIKLHGEKAVVNRFFTMTDFGKMALRKVDGPTPWPGWSRRAGSASWRPIILSIR